MTTATENGVDETAKKDSQTVRKQVLASLGYCSFYIFVSSMMVFVNKALSHTFHFSTMNMLLLIQMVFTAILLPMLRSLEFIKLDRFDWERAQQVAPVSIFYCLNGASALWALKEMSVPSYTLVKRLAPLFTIFVEFLILGKTPATGVIVSVGLMLIGTYIAFSDDTSSSILGWVLGLSSCLLQALYLAFVKKSGVQSGLNTWGVLFYHSILSIPLLVILVVATRELRPFVEFDLWTNPGFLVIFVASLLAGFLLNYALFLCSERTSPTSTVVSGHVKALAQTVIGFFAFGGVDATPIYLLGTGINISGGLGYAYSKYKLLQSQTTSRN